MLSEFFVYLRLGFEHISDLNGLDHIVFIVALAAIYSTDDWRQLLWLVTSFTIGHSITLVLATLGLVTIDSYLVELLIPVTIVIVGVVDVIEVRAASKIVRTGAGGVGETGEGVEIDSGSYWRIKYGLALAFGLIHGLGFSNFLRALLGDSEQIAVPLLSFNLGLEFGQIVILSGVLAVSYGIIRTTGLPQRIWGMVLSVSCVTVGLFMLFSRI